MKHPGQAGEDASFRAELEAGVTPKSILAGMGQETSFRVELEAGVTPQSILARLGRMLPSALNSKQG